MIKEMPIKRNFVIFLIVLSLCISTANAQSSPCSDSDEGLNYDVKGTTTGYAPDHIDIISRTDRCENNLAIEYSCSDDIKGYVLENSYRCPNECNDGACIKENRPLYACVPHEQTRAVGSKSIQGIQASCGDGVLNNAEQCDDGNINDGDGCSSVCNKEKKCFFWILCF